MYMWGPRTPSDPRPLGPLSRLVFPPARRKCKAVLSCKLQRVFDLPLKKKTPKKRVFT
jgi:hypothetical protein